MAAEIETLRAVIDAFRPPSCPVGVDAATRRALDFLAAFRASGSPRAGILDTSLSLLGLLALAGTDGSRDSVRRRLTMMDSSVAPLRDLARLAQRLATVVLYATLDDTGRPLAAQAVGYDVFADRPRGAVPVVPAEPRLPPGVVVGPAEPVPDEVYDVVVVGSGAAGSVLAARLTGQGRTVALVESGDYVPEAYDALAPARPRPHDELDNLLRYYKDAGLQITDGDCRMSVLQGQCVGGGSVVNNAVCFRMPDPVRSVWAREFGAAWAVDGRLDAAYDRIAKELRIAPVTTAVPDGWINPSARYRAEGVIAEPSRGGGERRVIRGRRVAIAAGAVGSSALLGRTRALNPLGLPIGERFSFNFVSPVHAEYETPVRAFDGLQMGHYYVEDLPRDGFVIETWFSPPATQSLSLPGWMDELHENMQRYAYYASASPLVGSTAGSKVDTQHTPERIWIRLDQSDLDRLKRGLRRTCELFLNSSPAPRRVLIGARKNWSLTPGTFRRSIDAIASFDDLQISTAHPQGGNGLDLAERGVVRPDFRVRHTRDLYVVDGSVFPTSLGVNPQWTIMAMADLAAGHVGGD